MIRIILLCVAFVGATGALLWGLGAQPDGSVPAVDQVSRTAPDPLGLQPAMVTNPVGPAEPAPAVAAELAPELPSFAPSQSLRPAARPQAVIAAAPSSGATGGIADFTLLGGVAGIDPSAIETAPEAVAPAIAPAAQSAAIPAQPAQRAADDGITDVMRAMSFGIVNELKKPSDAAPVPAPVVETARAAPVAPAIAAPVAAAAPKLPAVRTYTVQEGDSLPGIAFRYYGTTVAYLQILQANPDVLSTPNDLRAGMILRVPELQ